MKLKYIFTLIAFLVLQQLFSQTETKNPNVLFIIVDDLMKQTNLYGYSEFKTPELDKLAKESMLFDRAYCQYPLCGPSRASLFSGMYSSHIGITYNQAGKDAQVQEKTKALGGETMPAYFKKNGYITIGGGKLYHNSVSTKADDKAAIHDFDIRLHNNGFDGKKIKSASGSQKTKIVNNTTKSITELKDGALVENAKNWLDNYTDGQKPFFMSIGIKKPHSPFTAPSHFFEEYNRNTIKVSNVPAPEDIPTHYSLCKPDALFKVHVDTDMYTGETVPLEKKKEMVHGYSACVSYVNYLIGDLVKTLKKNNLYENTIIVFTSDHGYKLGEYNRWAKYTLHEKDAVVPFLIRDPRETSGHGKMSKAIIGLVDIYPTLADLCNLPPPKEVDGVSFAKSLNNVKHSERKSISTLVTRTNIEGHPDAFGMSIITDKGYRYTQWWAGKLKKFPKKDKELLGTELYDHYSKNNTPISIKNLRKEEKKLVKDYRNLLKSQEEELTGE